jgi:hypothetical protein
MNRPDTLAHPLVQMRAGVVIDSFPSQFRFAPPPSVNGLRIGDHNLDLLFETSWSFSSLTRPPAAARLGSVIDTEPSKIALYSLLGNASSPFHAEPAHFYLPENQSSPATRSVRRSRDCTPSGSSTSLPLPSTFGADAR